MPRYKIISETFMYGKLMKVGDFVDINDPLFMLDAKHAGRITGIPEPPQAPEKEAEKVPEPKPEKAAAPEAKKSK